MLVPQSPGTLLTDALDHFLYLKRSDLGFVLEIFRGEAQKSHAFSSSNEKSKKKKQAGNLLQYQKRCKSLKVTFLLLLSIPQLSEGPKWFHKRPGIRGRGSHPWVQKKLCWSQEQRHCSQGNRWRSCWSPGWEQEQLETETGLRMSLW